MIVVFWHVAGYEWHLTIREFRRLMRTFREIERKGLAHIPARYRFLIPVWRRELRARRPVPRVFSTFVQLHIAILTQTRPFEFGAFEFRLDSMYYRLMCAVMFYTEKESYKTPNPFADFRSWTIVPKTVVEDVKTREAILTQLEIEAWYIPVMFHSIRLAIEKGSVSRITDKCGWEYKKELIPNVNIVAVREGYEIREIDGLSEIDVNEANLAKERVIRAAAFYRHNENEWRIPRIKFDEYFIRAFEMHLEECPMIKSDFKNILAFKKFVHDRMKEAARNIEMGHYDEASRVIQSPYEYVSVCVGWFDRYLAEEMKLTEEEIGVELMYEIPKEWRE